MNIYLIYSVENSFIQRLKKYFQGSVFFEIRITDFDRIWSDYTTEMPLITGNEMTNMLLGQVNEQWNNSYPHPDLILLERSLDVFGFGNLLKQWKKCDVFVVSDTTLGS